MTTGSPVLDAFLAALLAFVITWLVAFLIRLYKTAPQVFYEQKDRADKLEERLKPAIELADITCRTSKAPYTTEYRFDLMIRNGATALNNCLVKIIGIEAVDETSPYTGHLPHALRTARNTERGGGGPFHLRAGEEKRVPLCSRNDTRPSEWSIAYELGGDHPPSMRDTRDCDLVIGIYSDAAPTTERVHLRVGQDGRPTVFSTTRSFSSVQGDGSLVAA